MIERTVASTLRNMSKWFPIVSLTGPRQSGKSTLIKSVFPEYEYLNLENPETRRAALEDPVGFIKRRPEHLIIDEAQYAPELFSMIQVTSDERGGVGQYVLSGSQNFLLMQNIRQSYPHPKKRKKQFQDHLHPHCKHRYQSLLPEQRRAWNHHLNPSYQIPVYLRYIYSCQKMLQ